MMRRASKSERIPFLALLIFVFSPAVAHAVDFSGSWVGTGQMIEKGFFTGTKTSSCSSIEIQVEHLPAKITVARYRAVCQSLTSDWGPSVMEVRDGKIYEDDEETGTLEGNLLKTLDRSGGIEYAFNLRLTEATQAGPARLETYYGVRNALGTIVIEGTLQ